MSKAMKWIGRNLSLGGLVRNVGSAAGIAAEYGIKGAGLAASLAVSDTDRKKAVRSVCGRLGESVGSGLSISSRFLGNGVNKVVQFAGDAVGLATGEVARIAGASNEAVATSKKIGAIVGSAVVGAAAGAVVAGVAVAVGGAAGTSGAAATTSGLAALGGGSVAAGGGGMVAGQVVVGGIVAAGGASGAASSLPQDGEDAGA